GAAAGRAEERGGRDEQHGGAAGTSSSTHRSVWSGAGIGTGDAS
ncbi:MAG: hypothetical protein JWL60_2546, partial [Gemmatimonadetes bacterium]|nr:hypothetical protein [Gemmatimonadota bacterium]